MEVYKFTNTVSGKVYVGISKDAKKRRYSHEYAMRSGVKTPFYDALRSYGKEVFTFEVLYTGLNEDEAAALEITMIAEYGDNCYNLHRGGHIGFDVRTKGECAVKEWKDKLSKGRQGRQPAKGMQHSEDNKKVFSNAGKLRWDLYGRYPEHIIDLSFKEAHQKYGISKTHYYRLKNSRVLSNEQN